MNNTTGIAHSRIGIVHSLIASLQTLLSTQHAPTVFVYNGLAGLTISMGAVLMDSATLQLPSGHDAFVMGTAKNARKRMVAIKIIYLLLVCRISRNLFSHKK